jgi:hypothetical protein
MASIGYTTSPCEVALSAAVLAGPSCEHCLLMLFDVPAGLHTILSRPRGFDTVLPDRNSMGTRDVANRKYDAHRKRVVFCRLSFTQPGYLHSLQQQE